MRNGNNNGGTDEERVKEKCSDQEGDGRGRYRGESDRKWDLSGHAS